MSLPKTKNINRNGEFVRALVSGGVARSGQLADPRLNAHKEKKKF
jgi:hypothetical protein